MRLISLLTACHQFTDQIHKSGKQLYNFCYKLLCTSLFLTIAYVITPSTFSQTSYIENGLRFDHFQEADGLPSNDFGRLLQDSRGFLWVCTSDGIVIYDGYDFIPFRPEGKNKDQLKESMVSALFEDSQGFIWIGTYDKGLFRFDPRRNLICSFKLNANVVKCITEDISGAICAATNNGLRRIIFPFHENPDSCKIITYQSQQLPQGIYESVDTLLNENKRLASILYEEDGVSIHKKKCSYPSTYFCIDHGGRLKKRECF